MRRRGHLRVAAILDAAASLFAERGFDATTMTAVAEQSATAIGSLYRFFPTKQALADILLERHLERLQAALTEVASLASEPDMDAATVADALLRFREKLGVERAAAASLVDSGSVTTMRRSAIRSAMRERIREIVQCFAPGLGTEAADAKAFVLLLLIKGADAASEAAPHAAAGWRMELEHTMARVLDEARSGPDVSL